MERVRCLKSSNLHRAMDKVVMDVLDRSRYFNLRHVFPRSGLISSKSPIGLLERLTVEHIDSLENQLGKVVNMLLSRNNCLIVEVLAMLSGRELSRLWETERDDSIGIMDTPGGNNVNLL